MDWRLLSPKHLPYCVHNDIKVDKFLGPVLSSRIILVKINLNFGCLDLICTETSVGRSLLIEFPDEEMLLVELMKFRLSARKFWFKINIPNVDSMLYTMYLISLCDLPILYF